MLLLGVGIALVCRIAFAVVALQLLAIIGLVLAGGLLLLWVAWKMWRDLRKGGHEHGPEGAALADTKAKAPKSFGSAVFQVAVADISMSLDNVLAVAGAARDHLLTLIFGLVLSIALMGIAASFIARYMDRYRWLSYVGLLVVVWVAVSMIWEGGHDVLDATGVTVPAPA